MKFFFYGVVSIFLLLLSKDGVFQLLPDTVESGRLKCPFDPMQPFTSVLTGERSRHKTAVAVSLIAHRAELNAALPLEEIIFTLYREIFLHIL